MSSFRDERISRLKDLIRVNPNYTQQEIVDILCEEGYTCSQATIQRDLKFLGMVITPEGYEKKMTVAQSEREQLLKQLIALENPKVLTTKSVKFAFIHTNYGTERAICDLISEIYKDIIIGTFAGNGCVMIAVTKLDSIKKIRSDIKIYRSSVE